MLQVCVTNRSWISVVSVPAVNKLVCFVRDRALQRLGGHVRAAAGVLPVLRRPNLYAAAAAQAVSSRAGLLGVYYGTEGGVGLDLELGGMWNLWVNYTTSM